MTRFETKFAELLDLCSRCNESMQSVNMVETRKYLEQIRKRMVNLIYEIENTVNVVGTMDLKALFTERRMVVKFLYIILRGVDVANDMDMTFVNDIKCYASSQVARNLMVGMRFKDGIRNTEKWLKNDDIFKYGIVPALLKMHKSLLPNTIRCLCYTMNNPEYKNQSVAQDMIRFENGVTYMLNNYAI